VHGRNRSDSDFEVLIFVMIRIRCCCLCYEQGNHFSEISGNLECQGIWLRSGKSHGKAKSQGKVGEFCSQGKDLSLLDYHRGFGLINVHLIDILPAILSEKVEDFFSVWRVVTLYETLVSP